MKILLSESKLPTKEELVSFIKSKTYMDHEIEGDHVRLYTRANGDVGAEEPGERDIEEAKRVYQILKKQYPGIPRDSYELDVIDEWVDLYITIPK